MFTCPKMNTVHEALAFGDCIRQVALLGAEFQPP